MGKFLLFAVIFNLKQSFAQVKHVSKAFILSTERHSNLIEDKGTSCIVESETSFPGGEMLWKKYLKSNFKEYEVRCHLPLYDSAYILTAEIWFVIERDGTITDVKCVNQESVPAALKNEAIRLITQSPKWSPGQRNGRATRAFKKEKISIAVSQLYL